MKALSIFFLIACFAVNTVCGMDDGSKPGKLVLVFRHMIGGEELVLGNPFSNILGDTITVQKFKYYLSNFSITDDKGNQTILSPEYFLVDEADPLSKTINLSVPNTSISSIQFLLGVDSIKNVSGVQEGALDPLKGMFWTWNSGYIMAKLEGSSPSSRAAGSIFTYHIGGFRSPMQTMRTITLSVPRNDNSEIIVTADINQWFSNGFALRIGETPVCHSPGPLAVRIADNYSKMFSINSSH